MTDEINHKFLLDDNAWARHKKRFNRMEVPSRTILLREGEVARKIFLIESGCIRVWFSHKSKDVSFQFFFENEMVASIESLRKGYPSVVNLETIEPCALWSVSKKDLEDIMGEITASPGPRARFIDSIFERTFVYMKHFLSFIKDTPLERYRRLLEENPRLLQRVPQHYIASYLGISSVHLSRIKRQVAREKQREAG